jgi:putative SOS response-associated peptidase YedK
MCGRIIQASGPLRYQLVDGLDVPDSRLSNIPRRYNGAPSQELLVIRQNHATGERSLDLLKWGLVPSWSTDPKGGPRCGGASRSARAASKASRRRRKASRIKPRPRCAGAGFFQCSQTGFDLCQLE